MSMKFKVGDIVRVVAKNRYSRLHGGKISTVIKIWHGDTDPYELHFFKESHYFHARELEKVESENGSK